MKKILLTAIAMTVGAGLYAQGTVTLANTANSLVSSNVTGPFNSGGVYPFTVALYWGATGSTEAQLVQIGGNLGALNAALPGRFSSAAVYTTGGATLPGATGVFEVRAWTGSMSSYAAAMADALAGGGERLGSSGLFTNGTGGDTAGGTQPPTLPSALTSFTGVGIAPVPEPTTLALGGLGAAALLLFRRRKS